MVIGYTTGVFDLFHIGHLNLLKNAKGMCDKMIVGVTTDELVSYKGKHPVIPFADRIEIVRSIKFVDAVVAQVDFDKLAMCKKLKVNIMFVGDDWYLTDKWEEYENQFQTVGIDIVYFPRTTGISSTQVSLALNALYQFSENSVRSERHDGR
ncbi:MAG: adenylyltransferase/cytidyltransferase family protein [Oscillospiraceae bacterium]|nr:adenylyltransferase/cytidyltransferase family protein [Oscillospiraceae bacterium]